MKRGIVGSIIFTTILFWSIPLNSVNHVNAFKEMGRKQQKALEPYKAKDFSYILNMPGFNNKLILMHFKLYEGYVKNTNYLVNELRRLADDGKANTYTFGALKRRLGWEFDGMRLHEYYFSNLGGSGEPDKTSALYQEIVAQYDDFNNWQSDFIATGQMRGIGWVVLYRDPKDGRLVNTWINEHDVGHLAGGSPLLVMDVFEHAYMPQFGLNKSAYIKTFFKNVNWNVVDKRYEEAMKVVPGPF